MQIIQNTINDVQTNGNGDGFKSKFVSIQQLSCTIQECKTDLSYDI